MAASLFDTIVLKQDSIKDTLSPKEMRHPDFLSKNKTIIIDILDG
jgi:hypothetical protein